MTITNPRRKFSAEEKVQILRLHLLEKQPLKGHEHWHIDISYINIRGTFYYLCSISAV